MVKFPYMQFFTGDWKKDPAVGMCSITARGVWVEMLIAMHDSDRSGILRGTTDQLALLVRCSTSELDQAITEFQTTGVADVTKDRNGVVTVKNRRMAREAKGREITAQRQRKHRARDDCNDDVTPASRNGHRDTSDVKRQTSSSMSDSLSASSGSLTSSELEKRRGTSGRSKDVDARKDVFGQEETAEAIQRFAKALKTVRPSANEPQRSQDLDLLAKAAILSVTDYSQDWFIDSVRAVDENDFDVAPFGYFHSVLQSKLKLNDRDFGRVLAKTIVPDGFIESAQ